MAKDIKTGTHWGEGSSPSRSEYWIASAEGITGKVFSQLTLLLRNDYVDTEHVFRSVLK
jgi:hypothetical protein